ncbi:MAG: DUF3791 domain-containing protein [Fibromonadaceae bacterium]|jgi:hypothetical protein|nr:DUF3791 domain-containing protein [Fibromonadaceae bacterium]
MQRIENSEDANKISFIASIIPAFADAYKMKASNAYDYLKKYGGLNYLLEEWWALHTENIVWAVRDIYEVCRNNGGLR